MFRRFAFRLGVALLFLCTAAWAQATNPPETRRQLRTEFNRAYTSGEFIEAIKWGLKLDEIQPNQPVNQFNLACVHALVGNDQTAITWLRRSASNGFRKIDSLASDSDLEGLHQHPRWPEILASVRSNTDKYIHAIERAFTQDPPDVFLPPAYDPTIPAPLIIALHGYGGRPGGYPSLWRPAAGKIDAILAIPHGLQPLGNGFFWGDLEEAENLVRLTIDHVKNSHQIDDKKVILTGFSQGGYMAMAVGLRQQSVFSGVIPMAGGYISGIDTPAHVRPESPRYYFMVGSRDEAKAQCRAAAEDFEDAGFDVDLRIYPGVGHTFPKFTDRELTKALKFVLK